MGVLFIQKKRQFCLALLISFSNEFYGQEKKLPHYIDPYSINVAGRFNQINNLQLDWSIGEAAMVHTLFIQKKLILSTGFLQNLYYPLYLYNQLDSFAIQIKVGPNPFNNRIIIQSKVDEMVITEIQLTDFQGTLIYNSNLHYSGLEFFHEIVIGKLLFPICFLSIRYCLADKIYKSKYFKLIQN